MSQVKDKCDDHPGKPTEGRLSPVTVRRTVGVIRTFLRWLYRENYLQQNLADWFPLPKTPKGVKKLIEPTTLAALFEGASLGKMPVRDSALIALLADTGLRRTEIATVTAKQICFLDDQGTGYLKDVLGKGDTLRDIPFSPVVGELLKLWLVEREGISSSLSNVSGAIFIQEGGQSIDPSSIYQILKRCAQRADVLNEVWNTHSLRHSFAAQFWRVNRDTKTLSMILGHNGQKITEDFYVHPVPDDLIQAHTSVISRGDVLLPIRSQAPAVRPTKYLLKLAIQERPNWRELGRQFQMTDTGVRKMAKRYGLLDVYYAAQKNTCNPASAL